MAKVDLGLKRSCACCDMRFYDFNRTPILCPGCGSGFDTDKLIKARKGRGAKAAAKTAAASKKAEADNADATKDPLDEINDEISSASVEGEDFEDVDYDDGEVDEEAGGLIQDNLTADDELLNNISTGEDE